MSEKPIPVATSTEEPASISTPHIEKQTVNTASTEVPDSTSPSESNVPRQNGGFFPWLESDKDQGKLSTKVITRFPVLGAVGLVGSALTVLFSWMTLYFFNHHAIVTGRMPKPAAWLSIILSLNSILVHMAVSQGIAVSWWYRASKQQTTVADLHNVWATGSSVVTALTSWKAFNYIALATVLVATLPANGILLQNAMTTGSEVVNATLVPSSYSIAASLPAGMSADLNDDGTISTYHYDWQTAIPIVIGANSNSYYAQKGKTNNTCLSRWCQANVTGVGFRDTCTDSTIPYDLPLNDHLANQTEDTTIFQIGVTWDASDPYTISTSTIWKNDSSCAGDLAVRTCKLELGTVTYKSIVGYNISGDTDWWWMLGDDLDALINDPELVFHSFPSVDLFKAPAGGEIGSTTYGGIAQSLAAYYNSTIVLHPTNSSTSLQVKGFYAQQLDSYKGSSSSGVSDNCDITLDYFGRDGYGSPSDDLLSQIKTTLYYTSIWATQNTSSIWPAGEFPEPQKVLSDFTLTDVVRYRVIWYWWGASVCVTLLVVLFILPTFYGFWTLARKTTLSPFETARAFHAPILHDQPTHLDTPALLKTVGGKNLHSDLGATSAGWKS